MYENILFSWWGESENLFSPYLYIMNVVNNIYYFILFNSIANVFFCIAFALHLHKYVDNQ